MDKWGLWEGLGKTGGIHGENQGTSGVCWGIRRQAESTGGYGELGETSGVHRRDQRDCRGLAGSMGRTQGTSEVCGGLVGSGRVWWY